MSYHESRSYRETAHLDGSANPGNAGNCSQYIRNDQLFLYNSHGHLNSYVPPLAQPHTQFEPESTLISTFDDVTDETCWCGALNYILPSPLTLSFDHTVDSSSFETIIDWPLVGVDGDQNGCQSQLSPTKDPSRIVSSSKRTKRPQCEQCGRAFTKKNDLKRHTESKHYVHGPKYRCICGHAQPRKDNHKRHVKSCENPRQHTSYRCKCDEEHINKEIHLEHVKQCSARFYGCAGRPRLGGD
ncbi:hypothetical protein F5B19DRAFT_122100 [Rostrohypoxylon terebratum]|nr:hypothetical protein F5B19DRAFT_122100 [Rostrohypoxylon terebratum]